MDLFCNDKYWNRMEERTEKMVPQILKPDHQRRRVQHVMDEPASDLIRQWGDYDFKFKLQAQGGLGTASEATSKNPIQRSLFQASILNAEAEEPQNPGIKVPIKCTWYRFTGHRSEKIPEISSNVYQLSAKDLGCKIRVEAEPLDPDFHGKAIGEFGPV